MLPVLQEFGYFNQASPPIRRLPQPLNFNRLVGQVEYKLALARAYKQLQVRCCGRRLQSLTEDTTCSGPEAVACCLTWPAQQLRKVGPSHHHSMLGLPATRSISSRLGDRRSS